VTPPLLTPRNSKPPVSRPSRPKAKRTPPREIIDNQIATKQDTAVLEANLTTNLAETKADLIKWYIGTMFAMTALIVGLIKFFH
jgi:hypothetical protein